MSDSTKFDLTDTPLKASIEIAFSTAPARKATHWKHDKDNNRIILAWNASAGKDYIPFLTPVDSEQAYVMFKDWLKVLTYGGQPDHDGDNQKSFRIYCEDWGYIDHNHYTFAAIEPRWAMYGK